MENKEVIEVAGNCLGTTTEVPRLGNDPQSIQRFETILHASLAELFKRLCLCNWYIREHEIVNLFTFGELVPRFKDNGLDLTMIGIEFPVMQVEVDKKSRFGARKDLVVWPEPLTTLWKDCELAPHMKLKDLHALGRKPFAIIEWKVISRIHAADAIKQQRAHEQDIAWLTRNLKHRMMTIGYAVLVSQHSGEMNLKCVRISDAADNGKDLLSLRTTLPVSVTP